MRDIKFGLSTTVGGATIWIDYEEPGVSIEGNLGDAVEATQIGEAVDHLLRASERVRIALKVLQREEIVAGATRQSEETARMAGEVTAHAKAVLDKVLADGRDFGLPDFVKAVVDGPVGIDGGGPGWSLFYSPPLKDDPDFAEVEPAKPRGFFVGDKVRIKGVSNVWTIGSAWHQNIPEVDRNLGAPAGGALALISNQTGMMMFASLRDLLDHATLAAAWDAATMIFYVGDRVRLHDEHGVWKIYSTRLAAGGFSTRYGDVVEMRAGLVRVDDGVGEMRNFPESEMRKRCSLEASWKMSA